MASRSYRTIGALQSSLATHPLKINVSHCKVAPRELKTNKRRHDSGWSGGASRKRRSFHTCEEEEFCASADHHAHRAWASDQKFQGVVRYDDAHYLIPFAGVTMIADAVV